MNGNKLQRENSSNYSGTYIATKTIAINWNSVNTEMECKYGSSTYSQKDFWRWVTHGILGKTNRYSYLEVQENSGMTSKGHIFRLE